jgi:hypothetical protein
MRDFVNSLKRKWIDGPEILPPSSLGYSMEHSTNKPLPPMTEELVAALDKRFPDQCPDPSWGEREIWIRVGQRSVVNFLKHSLERQIESRFNNVQGS